MDRNGARELVRSLRIGLPQGSDDLLDLMASFANNECGEELLPSPSDSLAFAFGKPKTAALAFDRIYRSPLHRDDIPRDVSFYTATTEERAYWTTAKFLNVAQKVGVDFSHVLKRAEPSEAERGLLNYLRTLVSAKLPCEPTLIYDTQASCDADHLKGSNLVIFASISNVALVDEESLTWEQVLEIRRDVECRAKYRRLSRWVRAQLVTLTPSQIEDEIGVALDDYAWALKKHGIQALLGSLTCLLDPKFLTGASAAIAATGLLASPGWTALTASGLTIGRATVEFGSKYLEMEASLRKSNFEIAYIHEIKTRNKYTPQCRQHLATDELP